MAVPAVDPQLLCMDRMRKGNGLHRLVADIRVFGSEVVRYADRGGRAEQNCTEDNPAGQFVRPLWKYV